MKYLGVDFGLKRIGLATSEGELAASFKVVEIKSLTDGVKKVQNEAKNGHFEKVVVGLPEGNTGKIVSKFIGLLKKAGLDVDSADETLSSQNATGLMVETGKPKKKRANNDATAAAIILQQFLDSK